MRFFISFVSTKCKLFIHSHYSPAFFHFMFASDNILFFMNSPNIEELFNTNNLRAILKYSFSFCSTSKSMVWIKKKNHKEFEWIFREKNSNDIKIFFYHHRAAYWHFGNSSHWNECRHQRTTKTSQCIDGYCFLCMVKIYFYHFKGKKSSRLCAFFWILLSYGSSCHHSIE